MGSNPILSASFKISLLHVFAASLTKTHIIVYDGTVRFFVRDCSCFYAANGGYSINDLCTISGLYLHLNR